MTDPNRAVLNANDMCVAVGKPMHACTILGYAASPNPMNPVHTPNWPEPLTRAPLARLSGKTPIEAFMLPPAQLAGAVVGSLIRDTSHLELTAAQRLSHFPASPLVTISWFSGLDVGLIEHGVGAPEWQRLGSPVVIAGSQSRPRTSWAPTTGKGVVVCFTADVALTLFGLDLAALHDRFVPAHEVLDARWHPFLDAVMKQLDNSSCEEAVRCMEQALTPLWKTRMGQQGLAPTLAQLGRHWVGRLAWQAHEWRRSLSPRQVERRVKEYSGRSMREWQALVKTEGLFFKARQRHEQGLPMDWAGLALEEGFSDQAHLSRTSKRITGFSPSEFAQRYQEDESFWMYRLWV